MRLDIHIRKGDFSDTAKVFVSLFGDLSLELTPEEAATQMKDAWTRIVVPVQYGLRKDKEDLECANGD